MAAQGNVPHDDFLSGFKVGYQLIKGTQWPIPPAPPAGPAWPGSTLFLKGIKAGMKAAGKPLDD